MKKRSIYSFSLQGGREVNEDACRFAKINDRYVGIVADGLGGQGGGDVASALVVEGCMKALQTMPSITEKAFLDMLETVNVSILLQQRSRGCKMMSTVALAVVERHRVYLVHLGDTRIYRFRNGKMIYCSHDHSVTQLLVDKGELGREEMRFHPTRNMVHKCLGQMETPTPEIKTGFILGNEIILLCSDGFWEKFSDKELTDHMKAGGIKEIMDRLVEHVKNTIDVDSDNASAVLIG